MHPSLIGLWLLRADANKRHKKSVGPKLQLAVICYWSTNRALQSESIRLGQQIIMFTRMLMVLQCLSSHR